MVKAEKLKLKRNFWLASEIECMLKLIKNVQAEQGTTATTHCTFVQIANQMKKSGFSNKSPTQIRRKWFQMKSAYLCFKKGNVDRLLLIPEKFRTIIAQFVNSDSKNLAINPSLENTAQCNEQQEIQENQKEVHFSENVNKVATRLKQMNKSLLKDFWRMQESLMTYEQNCQALRDSELVLFFSANQFHC